jgi:SOR/SNZ family
VGMGAGRPSDLAPNAPHSAGTERYLSLDETARRFAAGHLAFQTGLAEMLQSGVITDVVSTEQAKIAEDAGAVAVMALECVLADIRAQGGVARMSVASIAAWVKTRDRTGSLGRSCQA